MHEANYATALNAFLETAFTIVCEPRYSRTETRLLHSRRFMHQIFPSAVENPRLISSYESPNTIAAKAIKTH